MIESEVAAYNAEQGDDGILVEQIQAEEGQVSVVLLFSDMDHDAGYNGAVFFVGTIAEAMDKGFDLDVTCYDVENAEISIGGPEIEGMAESHILITDEPVGQSADREEEDGIQPVWVKAFGKIRYVSEGIVGGQNKNFARIESGTEELSYIIFN
jgi:hypothetical protein